MPQEFVAKKGLICIGDSDVSGSLSVTSVIYGNLAGSSSLALSASYVTASNIDGKPRHAITASYASSSISSSIATFALTANTVIDDSTFLKKEGDNQFYGYVMQFTNLAVTASKEARWHFDITDGTDTGEAGGLATGGTIHGTTDGNLNPSLISRIGIAETLCDKVIDRGYIQNVSSISGSGLSVTNGAFPTSLFVGPVGPTDTAPFAVTTNGNFVESRLGFLEATNNTSRIEFTLANSGDGHWSNNFISLMNVGSSTGATYYTDSDPGASIFVLQGVYATKMAFCTYNNQPIQFYNGTTEAVRFTTGRVHAPSSSVQVGSFYTDVKTVSDIYYLGATDHTVLCDTGSFGIYDINLEDPSLVIGKIVTIKKINVGSTPRVQPIAGTIDGASLVYLWNYGDFLTVQAREGEWHTIASSTVQSASSATSASSAMTASYAFGVPRTKTGIVGGGGFAGTPLKYTVTFTQSFANNNYTVGVVGESSRTWTIESKVSGSFVINTNSNVVFADNVFWQAIAVGEFYS